ncbi:MAG: lon [Bacteroidetes bacterium]|nr:lon [Bacteroidota bacterium]
MKILVDGLIQARISKVVPNERFLEAEIALATHTGAMDSELDALLRHTSTLFAEYVHLNRNVPSEVLVAFENTKDPRRRMYYIASNILQGVEVKQKVLELTTMREQLHELIRILNSENDVLKIEKEIDTKVHDNIARSQRKFFIQEQIRILQDELGDEDASPEAAKLREDIQRAKMTKEAEAKAMEELAKLKKTPPLSPESTVIRSYLDWMVAVPWHKRTKDNLDIAHVKSILDEDHFGLEKPKDRILEHIAVLNLVREMKRARRGGDPRTPSDVHRLHARQDHPVYEARRRREPGHHPGRGGQDEHGLPRRSVLGAAGSARPGTELRIQ